jgi:hypothetical protein
MDQTTNLRHESTDDMLVERVMDVLRAMFETQIEILRSLGYSDPVIREAYSRYARSR